MSTVAPTMHNPTDKAATPLSEELSKLAMNCPENGPVRSELLIAAAFSCPSGKMTEATDPTPIIALYDRLAASSEGWRRMSHSVVLSHLAKAIDEAEDSTTRFGKPLTEDAEFSPPPTA